jgi:hypothetical protein
VIPEIRSELLQALDELGRLYPDWRFCQMVANMTTLGNSSLWDTEDGELLSVIRAHIDYRRKTLAEAGQGAAPPTS